MQHPDNSTLDAYSRGSLAGPQLLEIGDHVSGCEECRARLQALAAGRPELDLEPFLGEDATLHLSEEEMAAAAAEPANLDEEARLHLESCAVCQDEVKAARRFYTPVVEMRSKPVAAAAITPRKFVFAALAAGVAACVVLLPHMLRRVPAADVPLVAQLKDAGGELQLDAHGDVRSAEPVSAQNAALLAQVMGSHSLPAALVAAPGTTEGESLRSAGPSAAGFDVIAPRAEFTVAQPLLRWQVCDGAKNYVVEIYDGDFKLVEKSAALTATEWTPPAALTPGVQYRWMVKAATAHGVMTAPQPPAPEAEFAVAPAATLDAIARVREQAPDAHLLLASLYARAGMTSLAHEEVKALAAANPGSPLAEQLVRSLAVQSSPSSTKPAQ